PGRCVRRRRARRNANQPAVAAAFLHHCPLRGIALRIGDAGELQECLVRRELRDQRQAVARPEVASVERRRVERLVPWQRRVTQRRYERAIPIELLQIDRGGARAAGPPAHGHSIKEGPGRTIPYPRTVTAMIAAVRIAIAGAGVSGLTCGVVLAERGHDVTIAAREIGAA